MRRSSGLASLVATIASLAFVAGAPRAAPAASIVTPATGGSPWTASEITKLRGDLDAMLVSAPTLASAHVGVIAQDTATGHVLYERQANQEFQPASTLKLVVGSAAIDIFGPTDRWRTAAVVESDGTLRVVPDGDPFLDAKGVGEIAAIVAARGVSHLQDVVVDTSLVEAPAHPDGWTYDDFAQDYAPPISAAAFEENVVHLTVSPGVEGAAPVVVSLPLRDIVAGTVPACSPTAAFVVNAATTGEAASENTLDVEALSSGCRALVGSMPSGAQPFAIDAAVPEPADYLARTFASVLRARGISIDRGGSVVNDVSKVARIRAVADRADAIVHPSDTLAEIMPRFWIPSDNFVGETLLLNLGEIGCRHRPAPCVEMRSPQSFPKTRSGGLEAERSWLHSIGVDPATTTLADGSGLSQYDRITPRDLVTILQHDWNGPNRQLVLDSLPIGGARGTIEGIAGTPAAGRVFAKTGSMMHVRGLAGYLATQRHGAVTFAFEVDDWIGEYKDLAATRAAVLSRIIQD